MYSRFCLSKSDKKWISKEKESWKSVDGLKILRKQKKCDCVVMYCIEITMVIHGLYDALNKWMCDVDYVKRYICYLLWFTHMSCKKLTGFVNDDPVHYSMV